MTELGLVARWVHLAASVLLVGGAGLVLLGSAAHVFNVGRTIVGLRPWTVFGVGRDFGMTSEPTKAIKSVALGRKLGLTKLQLYDLGIAALFVLAMLNNHSP